MADLHDSLGTAGSHSTSENAAGRRQFFGTAHSTNLGKPFTVNERPMTLFGWNLGAASAVLERVSMVDNQVVQAEDVMIGGCAVALTAGSNMMFIPVPGTYRMRLDGGDPTTARVEYTNSQLPYQDYVEGMMGICSLQASAGAAAALEGRVAALEADSPDDYLVSAPLAGNTVNLTLNNGTVIPVDLSTVGNNVTPGTYTVTGATTNIPLVNGGILALDTSALATDAELAAAISALPPEEHLESITVDAQGNATFVDNTGATIGTTTDNNLVPGTYTLADGVVNVPLEDGSNVSFDGSVFATDTDLTNAINAALATAAGDEEYLLQPTISGTTITFPMQQGGSYTLPLAAMLAAVDEDLLDNGDGTYTFVDGDGGTVTFSAGLDDQNVTSADGSVTITPATQPDGRIDYDLSVDKSVWDFVPTGAPAKDGDVGHIRFSQGDVALGINVPEARLDLGISNRSFEQNTAILARQQVDNPNFDLFAGHGAGDGAGAYLRNTESFRFGLQHGEVNPNTGIGFYRGGGPTGGFLTFNVNDWSEAMRIDEGGRVGIGAPSGVDNLLVDGANVSGVNTHLRLTNSSGAAYSSIIHLGNDGGGQGRIDTVGANDYLSLTHNGVEYARFANGDLTTQGDAVFNGNFYASDERLKKNFKNIDGAAELLAELDVGVFEWNFDAEDMVDVPAREEDVEESPAEYEYLKDGKGVYTGEKKLIRAAKMGKRKVPARMRVPEREKGKRQFGLIAQQVQKIMPEAVKERDGILMVDYSKVSVAGIAAIKELKQQLDRARRQIESLGKGNLLGYEGKDYMLYLLQPEVYRDPRFIRAAPSQPTTLKALTEVVDSERFTPDTLGEAVKAVLKRLGL